MNLDHCSIEIRPRKPWEAVDLGMLMARRWWLQLVQVWIIIAFPFFLASAFLPTDLLWLQGIIIWWLKPLFERPLLFILSQTVFGQYPATQEAVKAFPKLALTQVFASLLWRRFSVSRSFDLPVIQLESLKGAKRSSRINVLHREGTGPAMCLTVYGAHIEAFLTFAFLSLIYLLVPQHIEVPWRELFEMKDLRWINMGANLLMFLSYAVVAPFYVATGFALYLNRRVCLEAWDLEIAFKRIVERRVTPKRTSGSIAMAKAGKIIAGFLIVLISSSFIVYPDDALAQSTKVQAKEFIEEIKQGDEFNSRETIRYPKFFSPDEEKEESEPTDWSGLEALQKFLASLLVHAELLLWLAVFALIIFTALNYRKWAEKFAYTSLGGAARQREKPEVLFGLDLREESLPDDISVSAHALWLNGERRQALALLYRASLAQLIEHGIELVDGDTEGRCLEKAKRSSSTAPLSKESIHYFESLTKIWQGLAYGHKTPTEDKGLALCDSWNHIWQKEGANIGS